MRLLSGEAVVVALPDPFLTPHRKLLVNLAQQHRLPSVYGLTGFVKEADSVHMASTKWTLLPGLPNTSTAYSEGRNPGVCRFKHQPNTNWW